METDEEKAKRFLIISGDYYSPQMFGFDTLTDIMMEKEFTFGRYGEYHYRGVYIKELK